MIRMIWRIKPSINAQAALILVENPAFV